MATTKQSLDLYANKIRMCSFSLLTSPNNAKNYAHGKENQAPKHDTKDSTTS